MAMGTYFQPTVLRREACRVSALRVVVLTLAIAHALAGAALMRPSFLTSMWTSSPGRERS